MFSTSAFAADRGDTGYEDDTTPEGSNNAGPKPLDGVWDGDSKIVVAIDIGSTQSGVAFTFLQKGVKLTFHRVNHWPGQVTDFQSKVPTLIWYDKRGKAVSFGAEAASLEARDNAEDNGWSLAKYFKLHLHPSDVRKKYALKLHPLPSRVSLAKIYADFMRFLLQHTEPTFKNRIVDGPTIWENYHSDMTIVIAHPNGWGMQEQGFLRRAAVDAGIVDRATAQERIRFVTEAEASVHYCLHHSNIEAALQIGSSFAVCDAGGSTVDSTVYTVTATNPILKLAEMRDSACVQAGGIYVDDAVEKYLKEAFTKANMSPDEIKSYTDEGVRDSELFHKRQFADVSDKFKIKLGNPGLRQDEIGVRRGVMTLPGSVAQSFFMRSVNEIIKSVDDQIHGMGVSHILLVGGFGDSPYLQNQLRSHFDRLGGQLTTLDTSTSKAVADGAVIWSAIRRVFRRAARWSFGIQGYVRFDSHSSDHQGRAKFTTPDGYEKVTGVWCEIVKKGSKHDVDSVCRQQFFRTYGSSEPNLERIEIAIYSYSDDGELKWLRNKNGTLLKGFKNVCLIPADLSGLSGALEAKIGPRGNQYWGLMFWVCMRFGDTQLSAYLEWEEQGETKFSEPIEIIEGAVEVK